MHKERSYNEIYKRLQSLWGDESDEISLMATTVCELHHGLDYFDWTGFYRVTGPTTLKVGPYQGGHGCLIIPFERGVCGACAREGRLINVPNVHHFPGHIACDSSTRSEIVIPVYDGRGNLRAVFDVDSNREAAFDVIDEKWLTMVMNDLGVRLE